MANEIYSRVQIYASEEAVEKVFQMVESIPDSEYGQETKAVVSHFYTEQEIMSDGTNPITEEGVSHDWLFKWVGCKWLSVYVDDEIRIDSGGHVPNGFLVKLWTIASQIDPDCSLECKFTDEFDMEVGGVMIKDGIYAESYEILDLESPDSDDENYDSLNEEYYDKIFDTQSNAIISCEEAIDTEDFEFPDTKIYRIANKKWEIVENLLEVLS